MARFSFPLRAFLSLLLISLSFSCDLKKLPQKKPPLVQHYVQFASHTELQQYLQWTPQRSPLISAHRGGPMPGYPENCIATFENAITLAPCLLECDVSKTQDGVLVMMHDNTLERTTTGKGKVGEITYDQLKTLNLKDGDKKVTPYRVPAFSEVLEWARGKAVLTVDVKEEVAPEEIVSAIRRYQAFSYAVVITYSVEAAQKYYALDNRLTISVSSKGAEGVARVLESGIPTQNLVAFIGVYEPPQEVYQQLHAKGIRTILGTMGNLDRQAKEKGQSVYIKLYENGADILATDDVVSVAQAIQKMARQKMNPPEPQKQPK